MNNRKPEYSVNPLFISRWSSLAMSGEPLSDQELFTLFEAAKWAPSSYNSQPWRFIYAKRGTVAWDVMFDLLAPFNQQWGQNAAVLVTVVSRIRFEYNNKPSLSHSFDTGAAVQNLALQATFSGLIVHAIGGFDYEKARTQLYIPDEYAIEVMIAIGQPGNIADLPKELQEREKLSRRKQLKEIVFEGFFKK